MNSDENATIENGSGSIFSANICVAIYTMLNFDGDVDVNARCEQAYIADMCDTDVSLRTVRDSVGCGRKRYDQTLLCSHRSQESTQVSWIHELLTNTVFRSNILMLTTSSPRNKKDQFCCKLSLY